METDCRLAISIGKETVSPLPGGVAGGRVAFFRAGKRGEGVGRSLKMVLVVVVEVAVVLMLESTDCYGGAGFGAFSDLVVLTVISKKKETD